MTGSLRDLGFALAGLALSLSLSRWLLLVGALGVVTGEQSRGTAASPVLGAAQTVIPRR